MARSVFVVYGRNRRIRAGFFDFLRALGLEPIEWNQAVVETKEGAPSIGEILDAGISRATAVIVLLTGDDEAKLCDVHLQPDSPEYERNLTPQARPNVLFEAGLALGRLPEGTLLVQLGAIRPFSDIAGRHIVHFDGSNRSRLAVATRLTAIGCAVNMNGADWMTAGENYFATPDEDSSSLSDLSQVAQALVLPLKNLRDAETGGYLPHPTDPVFGAQPWVTSQVIQSLAAAASSGLADVPEEHLIAGIDYLEASRLSGPDSGWAYQDGFDWSVAEIDASVLLAKIEVLNSKFSFDDCRAELIKGAIRDVIHLINRQSSGGWTPIREAKEVDQRPYSTIMAIWALSEAAKTKSIVTKLPAEQDKRLLESIKVGANWLLSVRQENRGWMPRVDRNYHIDYVGLTAQALYALDKAARVYPAIGDLREFKRAKSQFISAIDTATRPFGANDRLGNADVYLRSPIPLILEAMTYAWAPWTLLILARLSTDNELPNDERDAAREKLKAILARSDEFVEYVLGQYTYEIAENLFSVVTATKQDG